MKRQLFALLILLISGAAHAQEQTPVMPSIPFADPPSADELLVVPDDDDDPRLNTCTLYLGAGYRAYITRPGDSLHHLLIGSSVTPVRAAAINCLDDTADLPPGMVIGLPEDAAILAVPTIEPFSGDAGDETIFRLSAEAARSDEPVLLEWNAAEAAEAVYVFPCPADVDAPCRRPQHSQPVPLSGGIYLSGFPAAGVYRYGLERVIPMQETETLIVRLTVTCAQSWLITVNPPDTCPPDVPRFSFAVYQPFERGMMLYRSENRTILALHEDGTFAIYRDTFIEGQPNPPDTAPPDRVTPVRGFGIVWMALGGPDAPLGYGLLPEQGYDMMTQAAAQNSYTEYVTLPDGVIAITRLPGENGGHWQRVE